VFGLPFFDKQKEPLMGRGPGGTYSSKAEKKGFGREDDLAHWKKKSTVFDGGKRIKRKKNSIVPERRGRGQLNPSDVKKKKRLEDEEFIIWKKDRTEGWQGACSTY